MKKSLLFVILTVFLLFNLVGNPVSETEDSNNLTVYVYDSFVGEWGPGNKISKDFTSKTGISVDMISCGTAIQLLQRIESEGDKTPCDVVIGIEDSSILDSSLFSKVNSSINLAPTLKMDNNLVPFDYGAYSFNVNSNILEKKDWPKSLEDLTDSRFENKVILIDPRTSSTGQGLLLWTISAFGEEHYLDWWKMMKDNALTIADGWSSAYGLYTEGEAPIVLSFTTSPVYHAMYEDSTSYCSIPFTDGNYKLTEYGGILKTSKKQDQAQQFMSFILNEAQVDIATANSMLPANADTILPEAFNYADRPVKLFQLDKKYIEENLDKWLKDWALAMTE
ncbi:MAG: thiamine ABC transporter substrate-binding protein [Sphaerochaetaceae bacterium]|nr:thiamine ABC transporter substrate-binding protein [Sphaerochaetaceae bacterium]